MEKNLTTTNNEVAKVVENTMNQVVAERYTTVDLGNMFIKYYSELASGSFSSKITNETKAYSEKFERIELDGEITYIGKGSLSREYNKCQRDYKAQLLYAICQANPDTDIIETALTLLLPLAQIDNKKVLIESLKGKEFNFKMNGADKIVKISDKMLVLPEGFATYYSLDEETQEQDICIIDIGSRTVNICTFENSELDILTTIPRGTFDYYKRIANAKNVDSEGNNYTEETIIKCIKNGSVKVTDKDRIGFFNEMFNDIRGAVTLKLYNKIIFTGGGSLLFEDAINRIPYLPTKEIHFNPSNSNAIGAFNATKLAWEA